MFVGYELKDSELENLLCETDSPDELWKKGITLYEGFKTQIKEKIDSFVLEDGSLDGSEMQADWFPQVKADVFISHSHKDRDLAIAFSGWLNKNFGLVAFIDSCIWGCSDDLLEMIDNEYCWLYGNIYSYEKHNQSTSHVHMMLSTALAMMIDKTECIIFLNTPNSITSNGIISKTKSPWIYSEIATTKLVQKKIPERYKYNKNITKSFTAIEEPLHIKYGISTEHLKQLDNSDLNKWLEICNNQDKNNIYSLDILYDITKII